MSIAIITSPQQPQPAANKGIYVVSGSNQASGNYRYVADVEDNASNRLARMKCDKLPNGNGFFNISDFVKTLAVPTKPNPVAGWDEAAIAARYVVAFTEEYGTPPTVQSGSTDVSGIVWKAYFPQQAIPATSGYIATSGTATFQALTNRPTTIRLKTDQNEWLAVMKDSEATAFEAEIDYGDRDFRVSGITSGLTGYFNIGAVRSLTSGQTSDGLPGEVGYPKTRQEVWDYYQLRATADGAVAAENNACALALFDEIVPENPFGEETYTVVIFIPSESKATTSTYTVIIDDCEKYPSQIVYFRNALGGVDSYTFKMKNRTTLNADRSIFNRNSDTFGTTSYDEVFQTQYTEQLDLNSDWLTNAEFAWLKEMFLTSKCWVLQDGELIEAIINTTNYRVSRNEVDNVQQLNISLNVAYKNVTL
jgi:hypothetical protein